MRKYMLPAFALALTAALASCGQNTAQPATQPSAQATNQEPEAITAPSEFTDSPDALDSTPIDLNALLQGEGVTAQSVSSRATVLARAKRWIDLGVKYSMASTFEGWRRDCSGFVSMAYDVGKPGYNTATLKNAFYVLNSVNDLQPGDILNSSLTNAGGGEHVIMFVRWTNKANHEFIAYEENGYYGKAIQSHRELSRLDPAGKKWYINGWERMGDFFPMRRKGW